MEVSYQPQQIIRQKRDGNRLDYDALAWFMTSLVEGKTSPEQAAALAMAVYFKGMTSEETADLTQAMVASGRRLEWGDGPPVVDKHSTGGVGDKVSLVLAPLLAACGCRVPMISGRGLDFTGGTLDKLDSIPGYQSQPDLETLHSLVDQVGCAIIGQTDDLAPADRMLYAIRDVTATVESQPLITASILSKKIAAGLQCLVLDFKTGSGAFFTTLEQTQTLQKILKTTAQAAGLSFTSLISDMNQPLGRKAGNALEVFEVIDWLRDRKVDPRLEEVTLNLGDLLLVDCKVCSNQGEARKKLTEALASGEAAERFSKMVFALGGPQDLLDKPEAHLAVASAVKTIPCEKSGTITAIDTQKIGRIIVAMGAGRKSRQDKINYAVGIGDFAQLGSHVEGKTPLATIYGTSDEDCARIAPMLRSCFTIEEQTPTFLPPLIYA